MSSNCRCPFVQLCLKLNSNGYSEVATPLQLLATVKQLTVAAKCNSVAGGNATQQAINATSIGVAKNHSNISNMFEILL